MTMSCRTIAGASVALFLACLASPAWAQRAGDRASDTTASGTPPLEPALSPGDTTGLQPVLPEPLGVGAEAMPVFLPEKSSRQPLPPLQAQKYSVKSPQQPAALPGDTLVVPQIPTSQISDPELKARADSLNRAMRLLAIQERLLRAEMTGENPRLGLVTREDYLEARKQVLETIESSLQSELKGRKAALDARTTRLDSLVGANREVEIAALEDFMARYPDSRQVADVKFILGQLYYDRERLRNVEAVRRWSAENQRFGLGLIPVMPKYPTMNEHVAVPFYRDVVRLGTNRDLIPYSLYSLGKYHLEQARGLISPMDEARLLGNIEEQRRLRAQQAAQSDTARAYFSRLVVEFPDDTVNVPEAYYVLASHYNVLGGTANRDTAAIYCGAIVRDYWYSPRYQHALMLLAEINFYSGVAIFASPGAADYAERRAARNRYFADALADLAWFARDIDAFTTSQIPGVSPVAPPMLDPGRRDRAVQFMTEMITRAAPPGSGLEAPPPVETAVKLVAAAGNPPFGAELLRQVGDSKNRDYATTQNPVDLVAALTAYDSLLSRYATYKDGPKIQQAIIDNAYSLSDDPQERLTIYVRQRISFFERFNRKSEWAKSSGALPGVLAAADDSAAVYLERGAKWLYTQARSSGDRQALRRSLDYFVEYFETYPERPQAYELNWSLATELRGLGDYEQAYNEFLRISNSAHDKYRRDASEEAIAAAVQLLDLESRSAPSGEPQGR